MWDWLNQNSSSVVAISNLLLVLVWAFYLQLFIYGYRRQRRFRMLIGFGGRETFGARCLISNMSAEPIYIISVIATLRSHDDTWRHAITRYEEQGDSAESAESPAQRTREGPLLSGHYRDIGSFGDLLERALQASGSGTPANAGADENLPTEMVLTVVAAYGPEELPVAAWRRFQLALQDGRREIRPAGMDTAQVRSKLARRRLRRTVSDAPWEKAHLPRRRRHMPWLLRK